MPGNPLELLSTLVVGLPLAAIYLLPALVADYRHHRNRKAITVLNVLLGWTLLGWVIALVWSLTADIDIGAKSYWDRYRDGRF